MASLGKSSGHGYFWKTSIQGNDVYLMTEERSIAGDTLFWQAFPPEKPGEWSVMVNSNVEISDFTVLERVMVKKINYNKPPLPSFPFKIYNIEGGALVFEKNTEGSVLNLTHDDLTEIGTSIGSQYLWFRGDNSGMVSYLDDANIDPGLHVSIYSNHLTIDFGEEWMLNAQEPEYAEDLTRLVVGSDDF